jgi:glycosyltransferase involved in cell wall biosynthesis
MWDGKSLELVTVAMNFKQKGGDVVYDAYRTLKRDFPSLSWRIIGGSPPPDIRSQPGILFEGELDPEKPNEKKRFEEILANAFLLVHPTREDTSPLVITEAAYFGCPAISVNRFAISELVADGMTGMLIDSPDPNQIVTAVGHLLQNRAKYLEMRRSARAYALTNFTWAGVGDRISERIRESMTVSQVRIG